MKTKTEMMEVGILPIWHDKTWEDFTNDARAKKVLITYLSKLDEAEKDCFGYFIYGLPGVGKSLVANLVFKELLEMGKTIQVVSLGGLIDLVTRSWSDDSAKAKLSRLMQKTGFLCIEDFGKEFYRKDSDGRSFATSILEDLLVKRIGFRKSTFIISTINAGDVSKFYSANLSSLVLETCVPLQICGKDHRTKIQAKLKDKWQVKDQQ